MNNYTFNKQQLALMTEQKKASYEQNPHQNMTFEQFACYAIAANIKTKPIRYRSYGMYWWTLKQVLIKHGYDFGIANFGKNDSFDKELAKVYSGATDEQTIVGADAFWHEMAQTTIQGNNEFLLDTDGNTFVLYDEEMESLSPVRTFLRSGLTVWEQESPNDRA
ncbi:hypothetical protein ACGTJS_10945 [Faucicola mancuniensis]|uniref:hypothetical protein n=1 Tax=Faucicola mancuniensis TaxID=1309795 RepID=UPI00397763F5